MARMLRCANDSVPATSRNAPIVSEMAGQCKLSLSWDLLRKVARCPIGILFTAYISLPLGKTRGTRGIVAIAMNIPADGIKPEGNKVNIYAAGYTDDNADVELVSSDGMVFKVHSYHLMSARYVHPAPRPQSSAFTFGNTADHRLPADNFSASFSATCSARMLYSPVGLASSLLPTQPWRPVPASPTFLTASAAKTSSSYSSTTDAQRSSSIYWTSTTALHGSPYVAATYRLQHNEHRPRHFQCFCSVPNYGILSPARRSLRSPVVGTIPLRGTLPPRLLQLGRL